MGQTDLNQPHSDPGPYFLYLVTWASTVLLVTATAMHQSPDPAIEAISDFTRLKLEPLVGLGLSSGCSVALVIELAVVIFKPCLNIL